MSPKAKNYVIIVLAAATLTASSIAWNQSRQLSALNEELLQNSADAVALQPRPAQASATFTTPSETTNGSAAASSDREVEPATSDEPTATPRQRGGRPNFAALMSNPEFAQAMSVQHRAALDARYADLFKRLNLPPAQLEKLKDLLVERQTARMDVMVAVRESGLNPRENRDELRKLTEDAQAEVDSNIRATLGDNVFNQFQTFETTQPQRALVKVLNDRLSYSSTPLNTNQSDFLVNALAATATDNESKSSTRPFISDMVIQQAQSVLAPDQVEALKQIQLEQQAQQKVRDLMRPAGR